MAPRKTTTAAAEARKPVDRKAITLIGRLVKDPVLRQTKSGKSVSTIRIAVDAPNIEPTYHSVVVWNRTAEVVCEYLRTGRKVEVSGHPQVRTYTAADGSERTVAEVSAFRVVFLSDKPAVPEAAEVAS